MLLGDTLGRAEFLEFRGCERERARAYQITPQSQWMVVGSRCDIRLSRGAGDRGRLRAARGRARGRDHARVRRGAARGTLHETCAAKLKPSLMPDRTYRLCR